MNLRTCFFLISILWILPNAPARELSMESAKQVLDKLYQTNGNLIFIKPGIRISDQEFAVAQYLSGENVIVLERKLLRLCYDFGQDSMNALAFVLGHELIHCSSIQSKTKHFRSNFLARSHEHSTPDEDERMADVQGLFSCWLANYNASAILPELLQAIYSSYGLNHKLKGYPSLAERMNTTQELVDQVKILTQVFENALYLMAAHEFQLARSSFLYLEKFYPSYEIYNNLGVCYLLDALQLHNPYGDYFYPIVIDPSYQIEKLANPRGEQNAQNAATRIEYLKRAQFYLNKALRLNYNYFTAELNLMCVQNLLGNSKEVITKYKETELAKRKLMGVISGLEFNQGRAILALAYLNAHQSENALILFDKIILHSADSFLVRQTRCNKALLTKNICFMESEKMSVEMVNSKRLVDGVKLHRQIYIGHQISLIDQFELAIKTMPESTVYIYSNNKQVQFAMQRMSNSNFYNKSVKLNSGNSLLRLKSNSLVNYKINNLIFMVNNANEKIKEVVYYNSYRT